MLTMLAEMKGRLSIYLERFENYLHKYKANRWVKLFKKKDKSDPNIIKTHEKAVSGVESYIKIITCMEIEIGHAIKLIEIAQDFTVDMKIFDRRSIQM
jgi:hypothetical protein